MEDLAMNPVFWQGKRVFLTGHTGFKGSWLSLWLQHMGAELTGFALAPATSPNLYALASIEGGLDSHIGDIRDLPALVDSITAVRPEIVIHMAAQALVRPSYDFPVETYATNVMGTVHLLEAVRRVGGVKAVVIVTTDKCYENREWSWGYRENEAMGGHDPYSSSKGCAELVSAAYRSSYFDQATYTEHRVAVATARAGNVIGGGDWSFDRLIPDILRAFAGQRAVQIRNPNSIRPWQYVLEPLHGYLTLAELLYEQGSKYAEGWNFGPNESDAKPVKWIVAELAKAWGANAEWQLAPGEHPHEAHYLKLDISKARSQLNWHPQLTLDQALALVVEWEKAKEAGADPRALTLSQIIAYQAQITN